MAADAGERHFEVDLGDLGDLSVAKYQQSIASEDGLGHEPSEPGKPIAQNVC